jgi:hypothetical protein
MEKTRLTLSASWFAMKIFQRKRKNDENLWIYMKNLNSGYNLGVWMDLE